MDRQGDAETRRSDDAYRLACNCIERNYDFVLTMDAEDGHIIQVLDTRLKDVIIPGSDYDKTAEKLIRRAVIPNDAGTLRDDVALPRIKEALSRRDSYAFRFTGENLDGEL